MQDGKLAQGGGIVSDWGSPLSGNITLTAVWETAEGTVFVDPAAAADGTGTEEDPYNSITTALENENAEVILIKPGKLVTGADPILITRGITIAGINTPVTTDDSGRATGKAADESLISTIDGRFEINTGEPVTFEKINVTQSQFYTWAPIYTSDADAIDLTLREVLLEPDDETRGIQFTADSVSLDIDSTYIGITAGRSNRIGIFLFTEFDQSAPIPGTSADVTISNSSVYIKGDDQTDLMGMDIEAYASLSLDIENSSFTETNHGYGVRLLAVGTEEETSTVNITDSYLQGWGAYYIQENSKNIDTMITDSDLVGIGTDSDRYYYFGTVVLDTVSDCHVDISGGSMSIDEKSEATGKLFAIYSNSSDSSIKISNTKLTYSASKEKTPNFNLGENIGANSSVQVDWSAFSTDAVQGDYEICTADGKYYYLIPEGKLIVCKYVPRTETAVAPVPVLFTSIDEAISYLNKQSGIYKVFGAGEHASESGIELTIPDISSLELYGADENPLVLKNVTLDSGLLGTNKISIIGDVQCPPYI